jgi:exonuclease III
MTTSLFRLLSWNVANRVRALPAQLQVVLQREPHLIALQELTATTIPRWRTGLSTAGFHVVTSFDLAKDASILTNGRKYGVLIASWWPLEPLPPTDFEFLWHERVLSVVVQTPWGPIECHTAHLPAGVSHGWKKIDTFNGIHKRLAVPPTRPRILCGDFNSPRLERSDGTVITWGKAIRQGGQIIGNDPNDHWSQGEQSVITGLARYDLPDIFRLLNGYSIQEQSWVRQIWGKEHGRRFDHIFASCDLKPQICHYLHEYRKRGLSDHSPIEADFTPD